MKVKSPQLLKMLGLLILTIAMPAFTPLWAEEADVYLKDGRRLHGDVKQTDTQVIVSTPAGELKFDKADVVRVVSRVTPDDEYRNKVAALAPGDVAGHYNVAEWAYDIGRWDLVAKQCRYILGLEPNHANAKLLLEKANRKQAEQTGAKTGEPAANADEPGADEKSAGEPVPLVSKADIERLKLYELSLIEPAEELRVKFTKKRGQTEVPTQFVRDMKGQDGYDEEWAKAFPKRKPFEQLREIVGATGIKYVDQIEITDDPKVFATFKKKVLPLVMKGCARSGCHGGATAHEFRLPGARQNDAVPYTAFVILDASRTQHGPLLDRDDPEASILLKYMLPQEGNEHAHPPVKRANLTPVFRSADDHNYGMVLEWINQLRTPHPSYELDYAIPGHPTSRPTSAPVLATKPATEKPDGPHGPVDDLPDKNHREKSPPPPKDDGKQAPPLVDDNTPVFRTQTGEKYHREDCSFLKTSKIQLTLKEARSKGLKPCLKCKPPA